MTRVPSSIALASGTPRLRLRVLLSAAMATIIALPREAAAQAQANAPETVGATLQDPAPPRREAKPGSAAAVKAEVTNANVAATPTGNAVEAITVTAQKRKQSINSVPISVTALSGDALLQRGITTTADLAKVVPGFAFAPTTFGDPVYVIRGVGLYDSGLGSSPAVTVYLDQVALPFPVMTEVQPSDLERVEVLKGPQGTLFGQNSTGGAINYIAAKPTHDFEAGTDVTYERFGQVDTDAFVSGPLASTLDGRASIRTVQGGAYQYSTTRRGDSLGNANTLQGRGLLDWHPTEDLKFELDVNSFYDGSDTLGQQLTAIVPAVPTRATPGLLRSPLAPSNDRAADWPDGYPLHSNDKFYQVSLRGDYAISPDISLTSLTSYEHISINKTTDATGTSGAGPELNLFNQLGYIGTFGEELRLSGHEGPFIWVAGVNYQYSDISDAERGFDFETADQPVGPFAPPFHYPEGLTRQTVNDYAVFGNLDWRVTDRITLHGGFRETESERRADSCTFDFNPAGDQNGLSLTDDALQFLFREAGLKTTLIVPVAPGGCVSLTPAPDLSPTRIHSSLNEQNFSFRLGADYTFPTGTLLYVSDNVGYKSGIISPILASTTSQFTPVKQERIDAYELGFKAPLFEHRLQFNGAIFYDSYDDKQLRTDYVDPVFGLLQHLVNIPRSDIYGAEAELKARPISGLTLGLSGTYLHSEVTKSFSAFNGEGAFGDYKGAPLPYTPKFEIVADGQYDWELTQRFDAFVGTSLSYHSTSYATFNTAAAPAPDFKLPAYAIVDLRGGLSAEGGRYRLTLFAHNVGDTFYYTTVNQTTDTRFRSAGLPQVYGATFSYRFR